MNQINLFKWYVHNILSLRDGFQQNKLTWDNIRNSVFKEADEHRMRYFFLQVWFSVLSYGIQSSTSLHCVVWISELSSWFFYTIIIFDCLQKSCTEAQDGFRVQSFSVYLYTNFRVSYERSTCNVENWGLEALHKHVINVEKHPNSNTKLVFVFGACPVGRSNQNQIRHSFSFNRTVGYIVNYRQNISVYIFLFSAVRSIPLSYSL
jgi:hypothetical protein